MLSSTPSVHVLLADGDPTVPVVAGMIALFMLVGLAVFVRLRKRWTDFKQVAEQHGFSVVEKPPRFIRNWRTLGTKSDEARTLEIREQEIPGPENSTYAHELTLRPATTRGLEFLLRPKNAWRKLEPLGDTRAVTIGDPEFDAAWLLETNQPTVLRAALTPELRAQFADVRRPSGITKIALENGLITIRDDAHFLPVERFTHALALAQALATVAEGWAQQPL